jgi:hypothetical protein
MKYVPVGLTCLKGKRELCDQVSLSISAPCARRLSTISLILVDPDGIPVQDGIGYEAPTTGLVPDLRVIARRKFPLVGNANAAGQLVPIFAFLERELDRLPEIAIGQVTQNILRLDDAPPVGHCPG